MGKHLDQLLYKAKCQEGRECERDITVHAATNSSQFFPTIELGTINII